jgi:fucose permease
MRTIAFSINVIAINILGAFCMIMLVGYISDIYGIQTSLIIISLFAFVASFLFLLSKQEYHIEKQQVNAIAL